MADGGSPPGLISLAKDESPHIFQSDTDENSAHLVWYDVVSRSHKHLSNGM